MTKGGPFMAVLKPAEASALMREVNGQGGFQSLLRALQKQFDRQTSTVTLTGEQIEKINRYTTEYGAGGFEDRLDGVRRELPKLLG
jgi:dihydroxyacid dehydratase/phosphogluconate dehydratase